MVGEDHPYFNFERFGATGRTASFSWVILFSRAVLEAPTTRPISVDVNVINIYISWAAIEVTGVFPLSS